jgi:uncharacterized membrane protein YeaQ/YmgE (transglycosylase-associated protein family)
MQTQSAMSRDRLNIGRVANRWIDLNGTTAAADNGGVSLKRGNTMDFVWFILIGLVAGWLAGQFMKGGGFGVVGDIVVGVVGALVGGFLFRTLGVSSGGGLIGAIVVATIGAVVLIVLLRLIKRA